MRTRPRQSAATVAPLVLAALLGCTSDRCDALCREWHQVTTGQAECAAALLEIRGYPVLDVPACIGVELPEQCRSCRALLDLEPEDCRAVYETCIVGPGLSDTVLRPERSRRSATVP